MTDLALTPPTALLTHLQRARRVVALTGAGMSADSGVATFRDKDTGLWSRFDPQQMATPEAFQRDPATVWAWYEWRRHRVRQATPNAGHRALSAMQASGHFQSFDIVTQNVDDLHERAGAAEVLHLHGSLLAPRCFGCGRSPAQPLAEPPADVAEGRSLQLAPPRCEACGEALRPGVVWFGEALPPGIWQQAEARVAQADLLLVIGTSGQVYPAAHLAQATQTATVAVLNPDAASLRPAAAWNWQVTAAQGLPLLATSLGISLD